MLILYSVLPSCYPTDVGASQTPQCKSSRTSSPVECNINSVQCDDIPRYSAEAPLNLRIYGNINSARTAVRRNAIIAGNDAKATKK